MNTLAIIVTYNDATNCMITVGSLVHQAEVVVWDNASTDGTERLMEEAFPGVKVHVADENMLWTPALNAATDLYWDGEKNLLFSNNDIRYEPNVVEILSRELEDPTMGLVAPAGSGLGSAQDFAIWQGARAPGWGKGMTGGLRRHIATLPTVRAPHVVGAAMMVQPSLRHEIGPLDNDMPLGADDHDYCIRAREAGYKVAVAYSAYIAHKSHASFGKARTSWDEYGKKSWDAFNKKWAGYFHNKEEAVKVHWGHEYFPGWDVGTGWLSDEARREVWEQRGEDSPPASISV